ncbi:hypothetical protein OkiPb01101_50310 [Escherichia coli]|nr:hypothetical protein [Escherichia coli]HDI9887275.1 hypothetical protein [Escherichia coli]
MSGSVIHSQSAVMVPAVYSAGQPASLPVAIDYPAALALRQMSMVHDRVGSLAAAACHGLKLPL